jgi:hypothetical protein
MDLHAGRVSSQMSFAAISTSSAGISQVAFLIFASVLDSRGWRDRFRNAVTSRQTYLSAALALAGSAGSVAPPVARAGAQVRVEVPPVTMG